MGVPLVEEDGLDIALSDLKLYGAGEDNLDDCKEGATRITTNSLSFAKAAVPYKFPAHLYKVDAGASD